MSEINLRNYQIEAIMEIYKAWIHKKNVLLQMPTGAGKTIIFLELLKKELGKKILIVAHRKELLDQPYKKLLKMGIKSGLIYSDINPNPELDIQIASIQTLNRRNYPEADLVIIDEAHHTKAKSYQKLFEYYSKARILGVTATVWRLDGEGFEDLFSHLICGPKISKLIKENWLCKVRHLAISIPKVEKVTTSNGDYDLAALCKIVQETTPNTSLVEAYLKYALGKKTVVFCCTIEHSKAICLEFQRAGYKAAHIDLSLIHIYHLRMI